MLKLSLLNNFTLFCFLVSRAFQPKKNKISFATLFKKHVQEYCTTTSIHGLPYTAKNEYNKIERRVSEKLATGYNFTLILLL